MSNNKKSCVVAPALADIPWEEPAADCEDLVWRFSGNPVLGWNPTPRTARIFNSSVVPFGQEFAGVFRADQRNGMPLLYSGFSPDALQWRISDKPIDWLDVEGNSVGQANYAYDPRVIPIEGRYYIMWCDDFPGPSIGLGVTDDFIRFMRMENSLMPFNRNGVLFPRKINGHYVMLSRPSDSGHTPFGDIVLSHSPDLTFWGKHRLVMRSGGAWWQGVKIGAGPAPIETTQGWLLFYHGVSGTCNGFVYSMGAALLDLDEPWRVIHRTSDYLLTPEKDYETTGFVPNVVFPCATLVDGDTGRIAIYYGAADTYTAVAFARVDEILEHWGCS